MGISCKSMSLIFQPIRTLHCGSAAIVISYNRQYLEQMGVSWVGNGLHVDIGTTPAFLCQKVGRQEFGQRSQEMLQRDHSHVPNCLVKNARAPGSNWRQIAHSFDFAQVTFMELCPFTVSVWKQQQAEKSRVISIFESTK